MTASVRLPVFPLPLVLLPQGVQPLHIFEPRYRQLLSDCLAGTREFGIVCRTPEVAEREIPPGTAGCVAHIETSQSLPDGRSNITVVGRSRFTLDGFVDAPAPYHVADVTPFDDVDESEAEMGPLAQRVRLLFERVGRSARTIQDDSTPLPELPTSPAALSFAIGQYIDLELGEKQRLLASRSPLGRLRQLEDVLAPIVESVEHRARIHTRAKRNGHGTHP
ncbi:MAG TPA: LON peptidase substrate-binding domain-containing protein [Gemmatimonadaceae bacterium]|nr:LON peptidase substrate-binding domain-containing protein [Gemmatimonadaceae bacterium]